MVSFNMREVHARHLDHKSMYRTSHKQKQRREVSSQSERNNFLLELELLRQMQLADPPEETMR